MLKLVKTPQKPRPQMALTMGGPAPVSTMFASPGLTFAQHFAEAPSAKRRPELRLVTNQADLRA